MNYYIAYKYKWGWEFDDVNLVEYKLIKCYIFYLSLNYYHVLFYSYRSNLGAFSFINTQAIYIFLSGIVSKTGIWHKRRFPFTVGIDLVFDFLAAAQKTLHDSTPSVETKDLV